jgi:penicillin-binding protein 1A
MKVMHNTFFNNIFRRLILLFYFILTAAGLFALLTTILFFVTIRDLPRIPEPLNRIIETPPTQIFAGTGERILVLGGREAVPLNRVSPHFIQAVLATEDHRFWKHHGVDKLRTLKALWVTLFRPGKIQGASTITQQLAKNLFFSFKRSYKRKFQELMIALQIESQYSKEEILQAYLNQIPFGVGAHGIENAAQTFFGKPASDLNLAESALLAGLPKSPTRYNPYLYFDNAKKRQQVVLQRMLAVKAISPMEAQRASTAILELKPQPSGARTGSYFLDTVIKQLEERYGTDVVYHGGLKVTTTLNPEMQNWAVEALQNGLQGLDRMMGLPAETDQSPVKDIPKPQGAIVAVETNSGAVKALVGGRDYSESEYNRALQNNRLPGSGFKPFLYYTAFDTLNYHPATLFVDHPVRITVKGGRDWQPQNFSRKHEGRMTLKKAFIDSVNTIAAQLIQQTGPENVIQTARLAGIESPLAPVLSVALGTSGVSPLEMASAFGTFATGGIRHQPFFIWRVEDPFGRVLEEHIVTGKKSLDPATVYQVVDMMRDVIDSGTGSVVRELGFNLPAGGKTGTTNNFMDAWFTGFTPTLSASVWVGYDQGVGLLDTRKVGITGGRGAAPIWTDFMIKATGGEPAREFSIPPNIRFESIDPATGLAASYFTENPMRVALKEGQSLKKSVLGFTF